jgi:hypothetical protein
MNLNDLLVSKGIDPQHVLVLRHRPSEDQLNKVLPWLVTERSDLFNAYQQTQGVQLEGAMQKLTGAGYVASFIRHGPGKALFVGLYSIGKSKSLTYEEYWKVPANVELRAKFGMNGWSPSEGKTSELWFDLERTDFYASWQGKLVVGWPKPEIAWWRRAHHKANEFPVLAILEDSALDAAMPEWDEMEFGWEEIQVIPMRWRSALSQWRCIYYIFDTSDRKAYVLLGRWLEYAAHGDGGNRLLRQRDPRNLRFTILQRLSPDMDAADVIRLEGTWKERLHTRHPYGLNDN